MPDAPAATMDAQTGPAPDASLIDRLGLDRGHAAVVGLQWGDEGKGQIVDLLTGAFDAVARFNGGNNAGHSVQIGEQRFALHLIPSGIIHAEKLNVIGNGVVVDPSPETGILKEIAGLRERGVTVADNLRISDHAHVVMPYHKFEDVLLDQAAAQALETTTIGTTGRGIGPCYADKAHRTTALRMADLLDAQTLRAKLTRIAAVKNITLRALAGATGGGERFEPIDPDALAERASEWGERLRPHVCDTRHLLAKTEAAGQRILFEGANAALLDVDHGTYPYVTSSSTSALGIASGTGLPMRRLGQVIGVAKAYTSRVGGGPHPTELHDAVGEQIRDVGREFGTTTGRPRRCGWLDLTAVRYSAAINGCTALVLTGLAVLRGLGELKVCVGYRYRGRTLSDFPADAQVLAEAEPIYETLAGFDEPVDAVRRYGDLPAAARGYVERVEAFAGVPVRIVCVGPRRAQTIVR